MIERSSGVFFDVGLSGALTCTVARADFLGDRLLAVFAAVLLAALAVVLLAALAVFLLAALAVVLLAVLAGDLAFALVAFFAGLFAIINSASYKFVVSRATLNALRVRGGIQRLKQDELCVFANCFTGVGVLGLSADPSTY